jgi:hypothetical protein
MLAKSLPVPTLGIMNLMNLREMIERCKEETELDPVLSNLSIYQVQGSTFMQIGMDQAHSSGVPPIFYSVLLISAILGLQLTTVANCMLRSIDQHISVPSSKVHSSRNLIPFNS